MNRDEALQIIKDHQKAIFEYGVVSIYLFGSTARNEATPLSDVDILIEMDPDKKFGMFQFLSLKDFLESLFQHKVDLVTRDGIKKPLEKYILAEAIRAA